MKKTRKTYGVRGMIEYQTILTIGTARMKVAFSGGSVAAMGVKPATFTTENELTQYVIEQSDDFKKGKIVLLGTLEMGSEPEGSEERGKEKEERGKDFETEGGDAEASRGRAETSATPTGEGTTESPTETAAQEGAATAEGKVRVAVSCNGDAREYLEKNYGVLKSHVKTRSQIEAVGEQHGVEFVFGA